MPSPARYGTRVANVAYQGARYASRNAGNYVARGLARGAARTIGRAIPYVGPAVALADLGYSAYKAYKKSKAKPKVAVKKSTPKKRNTQTGFYSGKIKGKAKKDNKERKIMAEKGGTFIYENGGTLSTSSVNCIYPFHGTATSQVIRSAFRAIVKELANQRKTDIVNWTDLIPYNLANGDVTIYFHYINKPGTNAVTAAPASFSFIATINTTTWFALADALYTNWQTSQGSGDNAKTMVKIEMVDSSQAGVDGQIMPIATVWCNQVKFMFNIRSTFTIQNRTIAENTQGDNDRDEAGDIENQPLKGKLYVGTKKWGNSFTPQLGIRGSTANPVKSTVAHASTGLCLLNSANDMTDVLKVPPPAYVLGFKKSIPVIIQPGEIKRHSFTFKTVLSFDKFMELFAHKLGNSAASTDNSSVAFGTIAGFGLEKVLDAQRSSGSDVSIGYQINQRYECALLYKKKQRSNPYVYVETTAVNVSTDSP